MYFFGQAVMWAGILYFAKECLADFGSEGNGISQLGQCWREEGVTGRIFYLGWLRSEILRTAEP